MLRARVTSRASALNDGDNSVGPSKRRKRRCGICLNLNGIETTAHSTGKKSPYYEEYKEMQKQKS